MSVSISNQTPTTSVFTEDEVAAFGAQLKENKEKCENLLKRRFVTSAGFEIHGGCAGLFDFGPTGSAIKTKLEQMWREHFVVHDDMLEVQTTCITPYSVFKASGHVDKFIDLMVHDLKTGENYRADKLLESFIENKIALARDPKCKPKDKLTAEEIQKLETIFAHADAYTKDQMGEVLRDLGVKSPAGNELSSPSEFNLMFKTNIGPKVTDDNSSVAFLRPETAQGMFVNFKRLYEQNNKRLPMGTAQIGLGFRNEIAPRNGLLRVREFQMAEIEYFVDPLNKLHSNFGMVAHLKLPLFSKDLQETVQPPRRDLTLREAVDQKIIDNETLAYFMARTYLFFMKIGIQERGIRFRQHLDDEMAHYATDCWDGEVLSAYGWVECCGHADRSAYDLEAHMKATKIPLEATRKVEPRVEDYVDIEINKKLLGPGFKKDAGIVSSLLTNLPEEDRMAFDALLERDGKASIKSDDGSKEFDITRAMVKFTQKQRTVTEEVFTPNVIEPSFGIGRIFNMITEHTFASRGMDGQEDRNFLALPPALSPYQCSLLPLNNTNFTECIAEIRNLFRANYISCIVDASSATIGKRYARTDEIGIPFAVTADFTTLEDKTVTVRERDSMQQIRVLVEEVIAIIQNLAVGRKTWNDYVEEHGLCQT